MHYRMLLPILKHALPILIHRLGSRLHNLIHASPILIHWLVFRLHILYNEPTRLGSQSESRTLGSQSESSITSPELSANQHRVLRHPSRQPRALGSQSESSITSPESSANQNCVLRHPRALGWGGGPFSALGSNRLAIACLITTWGPPPPVRSAHTLTTHVVKAAVYLFRETCHEKHIFSKKQHFLSFLDFEWKASAPCTKKVAGFSGGPFTCPDEQWRKTIDLNFVFYHLCFERQIPMKSSGRVVRTAIYVLENSK